MAPSYPQRHFSLVRGVHLLHGWKSPSRKGSTPTMGLLVHGGQEAPRSGKQALRHREEALATPSLRHTARRGHRNSGDLGCWATRGHEGWPREEADPVAAPLGDLTAPLCARSRRGREEALGAGLACHVLRPHAVLADGVLEASAARRRRGICQALKGDASTGSYCKHA